MLSPLPRISTGPGRRAGDSEAWRGGGRENGKVQQQGASIGIPGQPVDPVRRLEIGYRCADRSALDGLEVMAMPRGG